MSRYIHKIDVINKTTGKSQSFEVAYGFDPPLGEYFVQVFDLNLPSEEEENIVLWLGTYTSHTSRDEMYGTMKVLGCAEEHLMAVMMDLPF